MTNKIFELFYNLKEIIILPNTAIIILVIILFLLNLRFVLKFIFGQVLKSKNSKRKFQLSVDSFLLSILFVELIFLFTGFKDTYVEKKGCKRSIELNYISDDFKPYLPNSTHEFKSQEFNYTRNTNEHGFSDKSWKEIDTNNFRIMVLGDSFTEGDGTPSDSTWIKLLEQKFNSNGHNVQFFNAGLAGSDIIYEYKTLQNNYTFSKAHMVIIATHVQDFYQDINLRGGFERFKHANSTSISFKEFIYGYSRISRLVLENLLGYNELLIKEENNKTKEIQTKTIPEIIYKYQSFAEEQNTIIFFVCLPDEYDLINTENYNKYISPLVAEATKQNGNAIEILSCMKETKTTDRIFWPFDKHYTNKGNQIVADCLYEGIDDFYKSSQKKIK